MLDLEQQIFRQLEKAKNLLIVFSAEEGGDALASALALFLFLKKLNKDVEVAAAKISETTATLSFLPGYLEIKTRLSNLRRFIVSLDISQAKVNQIKYTVDNNQLNFIISPAEGWLNPENVTTRVGEFKYDLVITINASDLESLGEVYDDNVEFFYKTTIVNIDHKAANEEFGQVNFVDLNAVATSEILFYLLKNYKAELIDENVATCLLAGIIQQTKNFKTANLTPRTLLSTSQLITLGARREEIVDHLYRSRDMNSLKLWGRVLNNLKSENNNELLWSRLNAADFRDTGAAETGLTDIIDELIANVPLAKIIVICYEPSPGQTKVLLYTLKNLNALELLQEYSPTGTIKIARADLVGDLKTASGELIDNLRKKLDNLA